jgi:hypothetical protein
MALTKYVEMREGERWKDVAEAFLRWCDQHKGMTTGGRHEGDAGGPADGRRYAALSIPHHSATLADHLSEWAISEGRAIG